jgi:hypothetical protein
MDIKSKFKVKIFYFTQKILTYPNIMFLFSPNFLFILKGLSSYTHTHTPIQGYFLLNSYCFTFSDDESDEEEGPWRGRKSLGPPKDPITEVITQLIETNPPPGVVPLSQLQPQAIIVYGKLLPVEG